MLGKLVWGAVFAALFFVFSCKKAKDIDPKDLAVLYYENILTFSNGMEGCVEFLSTYGFYREGEKRLSYNKKLARPVCEELQKDKVQRWSYHIEKTYRNDELGKANYDLVLMVGGTTPYRRNVAFEKVDKVWKFYQP